MANLNHGGPNASGTTSMHSRNQKPAISNTPRMLTTSEIASLKKHKAVVHLAVRRFVQVGKQVSTSPKK